MRTLGGKIEQVKVVGVPGEPDPLPLNAFRQKFLSAVISSQDVRDRHLSEQPRRHVRLAAQWVPVRVAGGYRDTQLVICVDDRHDAQRRLAGVSRPIAVAVQLIWIGRARAVVTDIAQPVMVDVSLIRIGNGGAIVRWAKVARNARIPGSNEVLASCAVRATLSIKTVPSAVPFNPAENPLRLVGPAETTGVEGVPLETFVVPSVGIPPYELKIEGAPDWLKLDIRTGKLNGVPPRPGRLGLRVLVKDSQTPQGRWDQADRLTEAITRHVGSAGASAECDE